MREIASAWKASRRLAADEGGQLTVEWALILAVIALPLFFVCAGCLKVLVAHYQMVTFMETLPFP